MSDKPESTEASPKPQKIKKPKPMWAIIVLTTLKYLRVPFLCLVALAVGLYVGYVRVGKQPVSDMFHMSTWKHLYDLVFNY
jgi:hypothetical protein